MKIKTDIKAFTITEAIVSFTLIGLIFIATISNVGRNDNYNKLYYQAFNTLYQASKTAYEQWSSKMTTNCECACTLDNPNADETCFNSTCWPNGSKKDNEGRPICDQDKLFSSKDDGTSKVSRDWPGFLYGDLKEKSIDKAKRNNNSNEEINKSFCEMLTESINTKALNKCNNFISSVDITRIKKGSYGSSGINFFDAFAYVRENDDGTFEKLNKDGFISPTFTSLNGQNFYISDVTNANFIPNIEEEDQANKFKIENRESFRFVVVDLNGQSKPNTQFQSGSRDPDLVLFAINSTGEVIPLGLPEFSKKYVAAMVYYPNDLNDDGTPKYEDVRSEPMNLWRAKKFAWGTSDHGQCPLGQCLTNVEPLSHSVKFYSNAMKCKNKGTACDSETMTEHNSIVYADNLYINIVLQFMYRAEGSDKFYAGLGASDGDDTTDMQAISADKEHGCNAPGEIAKDAPKCAIDFKH